MDKAAFVQSKKTRKRPANIKPVEDNGLPKDLTDLWGAVEAVATAFKVIQKGTYTHEYLEAVRGSLFFLQQLHMQQLNAALKHPQAHLIPELKQIMDEKEGDSNGQTPA
jgi:hypothetical protein